MSKIEDFIIENNTLVKYIGNDEHVEIPNGIEAVDNVFRFFKNIKSIFIPESVIDIAYDISYSCCGLEQITVDINNKVYDSRNNCNAIIETATNKLLFGCKNTVIPDDVEIIGDYAFSGITALKTIAIPDGIKKIGKCAFEGCCNLTELTIPESVISIAPWAFEECPDLVIKGSKNSYAHKYAVNNNIRFETI